MESNERYNEDIVKKYNEKINREKKSSNKKAVKVYGLIFVIICIIAIAGVGIEFIIDGNKNNKTVRTSTTDNIVNVQDEQNDTVEIKKEYFDFIDVENGTFDFTENELLNKICAGKSYVEEGYKKSVHTENSYTNLYSYLTQQGVQIVSITRSAKNAKVSEVSFSFTFNSGYTQEIGLQYLNGFVRQGIAVLNGDYANKWTEAIVKDVEEIESQLKKDGNRVKGKGLVCTSDATSKMIKVTFSVEL